ncbi:MAG: hypothetical protein JSW60_04590 [Thermoplasmatales archaeon]|nr:MAG: hypothetical protein JSW60_04590 [Thermoplasmatales archaeon]
MPWQTLEVLGKTTTYMGYEYDGKVIFVFAIIILGFLYLGFIKNRRVQSAVGMLIFNAFILLVMYNDISGVESYKSTITIEYSHSYGIGIYLIIIGGIGLIFSCLWQIVEAYKQKMEGGEKQPKQHKDRYCPDCGRSIPFDANVCPYCGKKFKVNYPIDENVKTQKVVEAIEKASIEKDDKEKNEMEWKKVDS